MSAEKLQESRDVSKENSNIAKVALSLLEKETRVNFFKNASNWLKGFFWLDNSSNGKDSGKSATTSARIDVSKSSKSNNSKEFEGNYTNEHISDAKVKKARDYIANWWTFYSPSKWTITWGKGKYKHVCSTWSYAVLDLLWIKNKSGSNECDLKGKILPKMGLEYIWQVDPDNPTKNWYKPQNGDTAVWPRFNGTQHQATFINWHWVSDTIQTKMSCYNAKNEPNVKIYRYTWKNLA